jgi:hypothetical protein
MIEAYDACGVLWHTVSNASSKVSSTGFHKSSIGVRIGMVLHGTKVFSDSMLDSNVSCPRYTFPAIYLLRADDYITHF